MAIQSISGISQIQNIQQLTDISKNNLNQTSKTQFNEVFDNLIKNMVEAEINTENSLNMLASGDIASISKAIVGLAETDLTIKFTMEVRNKLVDAYKEMMQMQV
ncbi:MAG: flagellar hook-basal body complex protein FliE [Clostridia bacterium]|jgi:flagellar hook-basal body complex protein FliE|nr:flagellar hook-basal body complex protein FliE [Clostridia bacterium]MDD3093024.1 flagellar hook-basal body complex protein FliE [Clostridia bacterium]MDD3970833.1 flagellar hook-basal body complex protein FliE [Clostridia bacterium]MDD4542545.1 flagellar hook-basal body complex protein FliE [Clostridia bacterium]HXK71512.1 flagellar hook-basal body complex protein FliE [Clostridia bacterium]